MISIVWFWFKEFTYLDKLIINNVSLANGTRKILFFTQFSNVATETL